MSFCRNEGPFIAIAGFACSRLPVMIEHDGCDC
jgi:hypothetical protein